MDLEFSIGEAVGAGALATLIMTAVMYMGKFMLPRQMPMVPQELPTHERDGLLDCPSSVRVAGRHLLRGVCLGRPNYQNQ